MGEKKKRVLLLVHPQYRPDAGARPAGTEQDVWRGLRRSGHHVEVEAASDDVRAFDRRLAEFSPHVVFNLLEEFRGEGVFDFHLVTYCESLGVPCTGCNSRGLVLSRNKFLVGAVAREVGVPVSPTRLGAEAAEFPAFIKYNREDASRGITKANVVRSAAELKVQERRLRGIYPGEVITQSFVTGEEVSVAVWGNQRAKALAPWMLRMDGARVATEKMKFDAAYRRRLGVRASRYRGSYEARLRDHSTRLFGALDLSGYARFDYRLNDEDAYLIDVNANPNLSASEDFACSARAEGFDYGEVLDKIMSLARNYRPKI